MRLWCGNCRMTLAHRMNAIGALVCQSCGCERGPAVARHKCKDTQHGAMWRDGWARCIVCGNDIKPYQPNAQAHQTPERSVGGMVPPVVGNSGSEEMR